jgi:hypothetical protein
LASIASDADADCSSDSAPESFFFMSYPPVQFPPKRNPHAASNVRGWRRQFLINQLRRDMHRLMTARIRLPSAFIIIPLPICDQNSAPAQLQLYVFNAIAPQALSIVAVTADISHAIRPVNPSTDGNNSRK